MDLISRATKLLTDALFGPVSPGRIDLTLKFEQSILSILPACFVILATPIYVLPFLKKAVPRIKHSPHLWFKVLVSVLLVANEAVLLAISVVTPALQTNTSLAASVLTCGGSLGIAIILYTSHRYSIQPSTFLSVYLSISTLFHLTKARSYFLRAGLGTSGALSVVSATLNATLVILEEIPKRQIIPSERLRNFGKETISGFWNRALLLWLNSLLAVGFKNILTMDDLQAIGDDFNSEAAYKMFEPHWNKANKASKNALLKACVQTWGWEYAGAAIPRICYSAFVLCQPLLFRRVIDYVKQQGMDTSRDYAAVLIGTAIVLYLCLAITRSYFQRLSLRVMMFVRGALVTAISKKMLRLSATELEKSKALTLLSNDVEQIKKLVRTFHDLWAAIIDVSGGLYLLYSIIGPAAFLIMMPTLLSSLANLWLQKHSGGAWTAWNEKVEVRVSATSKVVTQLKNIKMSGLVEPVGQFIQSLREEEIKTFIRQRFMHIVMFASESFHNSMAPAIGIAGAIAWTRRGESGPTVSDMFVALAIIVVVVFPLARTMVACTGCVTSYASLVRVQNFLTQDEVPRAAQLDANIAAIPARASDSAEHKTSDSTYRASEITTQTATTSVIEMTNFSVKRSDNDVPILQSANLCFRRNEVTMVIGPVGCGKSTLIEAILGEVPCSEGSVTVNQSLGGVTYCGQVPWIQNRTIRDNIIGQSRFDGEWYKTVITACDLKEDISNMAKGSDTMTGSGGCNLSGGQRQRIALARSVYLRPSLIILDDVFSALDHPTAKVVLSQLFGADGIIRRLRSTVILATSSIEHLPVADTVLALNGQGGIQTVPKKIAMLGAGSSLLRCLPRRVDAEAVGGSTGESAANVRNCGIESVQAALVNIERQRGDVSLYLYILRETGLILSLLWLFVGSITALADSMPHVFLRIWMNNAPQDNSYYIGYVVLSCAAAASIAGCLWMYYHKVAPRTQKSLHWKLLRTVMNATMSFIGQTDSGSLLARFSQDMMNLTEQLPRSVMEVSLLFLMILVEIIVIAAGTTYSAILAPICFVSIYFMQYYYLRTARQIRYLDVESKSPLYAHFSEIEKGIHHIRAFKWEDAMLHQTVTMLDNSQMPYYHEFCLTVWLDLVLDLCIMGIATILIALALFFPSTTSQAAIGLSLVNLLYFTDNIRCLILSWTNLETSLGSLHRTREFITDTPVEPKVQSGATVQEMWPRHGNITFKSVTARYSEGGTVRPVLDGMSLNVLAGQKVGIIGRTGSGKSSTLLAILNMINFSGEIRIDGVSVDEVPTEILRSRIVTTPQDGVQLDGTVRYNLDPYSESSTFHSDEVLKGVLKRVGLADHVEKYGGLDENMTRAGFSHGQKQLLSLARAILRKETTSAKVVLVDEATSSIDFETGERIHKVISEAFADCTVITVAHRLQALDGTDMVFDLEDGKIKRVLEKDSDEWMTWEESVTVEGTIR